MKQTAIDWYFDKIKSHFEHDGDLFEVAQMTYQIAKEIEKEQLEKAIEFGYQLRNNNKPINSGIDWVKEFNSLNK